MIFKLININQIFTHDDVMSVKLRGTAGEFEVLPGHMGLDVELAMGIIIVKAKEGMIYQYFTNGGIANIDSQVLNVISEFAMSLENIDKSYLINQLDDLEIVLSNQLKNNKTPKFQIKELQNTMEYYQFLLKSL
jgi:F-type H+-transporting ATPase subunit epsilon